MNKFAVLLLSFLLLATSNVHAAQKMVQVKGSDTLINLVQKLAEEYMKKNPGNFIAVTGGGSGTGLAALVNKKCDIANSSRLMKQKEIDQASTAGISPKRVVIAIDGLSIITNAQNPVEKLTVDQIAKIYKGEVTNWKDVGGKDMPINLYGRQPNSGTYDFMKDDVLKGDYSPKMKQMNGNAQIVEAIKQDLSGVGYVGVAYIKHSTGLNVLKVSPRIGAEYLGPENAEDVISGRYPISRPLNQYINGDLQGTVKSFIAYELSDEGQKIVADEGFFAIPDEYKEFNKAAGVE
jgi:phosphate transport system substrate-binding protein